MPKNKSQLFSKADLEIKPFDAADHLTTSARIFGYLEEVLATSDPDDPNEAAIIRHALEVALRAYVRGSRRRKAAEPVDRPGVAGDS
jgi:hypothetical protein